MDTFYIKSKYDDLNIAVCVVRPEGRPTAVLQFAHGMCGHKERFEPVMEYLAERGIVCIASDHRGHGGSVKDTRDFGYFYSGGYKALVQDMRDVVEWGLNEFPGLPYYLLGHSMGSLAARVLVKQDDSGLSGLIICGSPSWNPLSIFGRALTGMFCITGLGRLRPKLLQKITSGSYNRKFSSEGSEAWTCSDPEVRKIFTENPLCNFRFTMNGVNNLLKMMGETYDTRGWKVTHPDMPVRFISGVEDPCMISEKKFHQAVWAMHKAGYENVSSSLYDNMRHEVLNEINKVEVWNEILDFMRQP
jgi:alpha-beta hydrolase superfamily lysophospholipase